MDKMDKPIPKTKEAYDYRECRDYLQWKYGYDEQDYTGKYKKIPAWAVDDIDESVPYQNFWHWLLGRYEIHNGGYVTFTRDALDEIQEEWAKIIYSHYLEEFTQGQDEVTFYVWW
jgi:hypothetical protein